MKNMLQKTKRGGASMFVVMFTTIILSIITLGFTRLIISEVTKTSNTDLSQSAYDSALAGIEDAKTALLQYHACLDDGFRAKKDGNTCEKLIYYMQEGIRTQDCSTVANALGREHDADSTENSVVIQETQRSGDDGNNTSMLQAYTCVTIQEELPDYRTTLNSESRLRIIPIRSSDHKKISKVNIRWYSRTNSDVNNDRDRFFLCGNERLGKSIANGDNGNEKNLKLFAQGFCGEPGNKGVQTPPIISVRLIQTSEEFDISELSTSSAENQTDTGQLYFVPKSLYGQNDTDSSHTSKNSIDKVLWAKSANKGANQPIQVKCKVGEWFCSADMELPNTFDNKSGDEKSDANTYLLVSLPYGVPETDISVTVFDSANKQKTLTGVQARIDSTGRANDLYRRVESRIELVDTYFAYPEFEITMLGGANSKLLKNFDVTFDCWRSQDGIKDPCSNSRVDSSYATLK